MLMYLIWLIRAIVYELQLSTYCPYKVNIYINISSTFSLGVKQSIVIISCVINKNLHMSTSWVRWNLAWVKTEEGHLDGSVG